LIFTIYAMPEDLPGKYLLINSFLAGR